MVANISNRLTMEINRQSLLSRSVAESQARISTGRRIQIGSDDPVATARVAQVRRAQSDAATWASNLDLGIALAAEADGVMATITDRLTHAQTLLIQTTGGAVSANDRATIAAELDGIAQELDTLANTRNSLGQPLFSGGDALQFRFDHSVQFAPVASGADVFEAGGVTLSQIMRDAAVAVQAGNTAPSLAALETSVDHIAAVRGNHGVRAARLDALRESNVTRGVELASERSSLEDTDLTQEIAKLNAQTITLEAAQAAFARINRRTLFDILG
jgi:flagellar hook-associated protein 3 FlgL